MSNQEYIKIEGAYENNLKHISLDIPKKQITIFTGVVGFRKVFVGIGYHRHQFTPGVE